MKQCTELYHWGIKGMKWGVRRYQNKDGTLTPAGKKRYNDLTSGTVKKSKYRTKLENVYMEKGLSRENAVLAADRKIKTQKVLAAVAGVTVAAASAYVVHRNIKERADGLIKEGGVLKRVESQKTATLFGLGKNQNLHDAFYVTDNDYDHKNYSDALGWQRALYSGNAYQMEIEAKRDIKIASQKKARDTLKKLLTDDEFLRTSSASDFTSDLRGKHKIPKSLVQRVVDGKRVPESVMRRIYDNFNSNLVGKPRDDRESAHRKMFYDALKKQGYGGVQDINDLKWSHLRGKNPLIVFDKSNVSVKQIRDITSEVSSSAHDAAYMRMSKEVGKQALAAAMPKIATASVAGLALTYLPESRRDTASRLVKQYKQQHPNTNLTNREIEKMLSNKK